MGLILRLISGFFMRHINTILTFVSGFWAGRTAVKNKQMRDEVKTHERIDQADVPTDADDARRMLRERADKRGLQRDDKG